MLGFAVFLLITTTIISTLWDYQLIQRAWNWMVHDHV